MVTVKARVILIVWKPLSLVNSLSAVPSDGCISKYSVPSRSKQTFLVSGIRAVSARVSECQKI